MSLTHHRTGSQNSRSVSQLMDNDELSDTDLIKQVDDLKKQIRIVTLENEVFERTIMRLEPSLMNGIQQALEYATRLTSTSSLNVGSFVRSQTSRFFGLDSATSPSRMLTSPSKVSTRRGDSSARIGGTVVFGSGPRINVLERSELVSGEMEILVCGMERARARAAKRHALAKAQLEEIDVREAEVERASGLFQKEVVVDGWDKIAQRIPAEIWVRFMTEWVKNADSHIGKLRLRTSTLNTQHSKLKGQIKVKTELSESLRPVDFEKLKIENEESLLLIEKKFQQLGELKKVTGDANLNLTIHKKALLEQNNYLTNILKRIREKQKVKIELEKEKKQIEVEAERLETKLEEVKRVRMEYQAPDIMEYVRVKAEVADLKQCIRMLGNRVHVQQIALAAQTKKLNSMLNE